MEFQEKLIGCMHTMESLNTLISDMSEQVDEDTVHTGLTSDEDAKNLVVMLDSVACSLRVSITKMAEYLYKTWK